MLHFFFKGNYITFTKSCLLLIKPNIYKSRETYNLRQKWENTYRKVLEIPKQFLNGN